MIHPPAGRRPPPQFVAVRSDIGRDIINRWSRHLRPNGAVVDIGCGTGVPVTQVLAAAGFEIYGIDPSPTLLSTFRRRFPDAITACEPAETSCFFNRRFDGAVAVGLLFLLPEAKQIALIHRVGQALNRGGHFLFSAPAQPCRWDDSLTGQPSASLGEPRYRVLLADAGLRLVDRYIDEGSNHYFHAIADQA